MFLLSSAGWLFWAGVVCLAYAAVGLGRWIPGGVLMLGMAAALPLAAGLFWPILGRLRGVMARDKERRRGLVARAPVWLKVVFWLSLLHMVFELVFVYGIMRGGIAQENPLGGGVLEVHGQVVRRLSPAALALYRRQQVLLLPAVFLFAYGFLMTGYGVVLDTFRPDETTAK